MQINYSNTTYGSVVSVTHEGQTAQRPTGANRTVTYSSDAGSVTLPCPDPSFPDLVLSLGNRVWERTEPDVDPLWQQWVDSGLITDELLADLPKPQEVIDAETAAQRKFLADTWFAGQVASGVNVPGTDYALGITEGDVALIMGAHYAAKTAVENGVAPIEGPFTIVDLAGKPHSYSLPELTAVLLGYSQARAALSVEYATRLATPIEPPAV